MPARFSGEDSLPGCRLLTSHGILTWSKRKPLVPSSSVRALIPFMRAAASWRNYLPKAPPPNISTLQIMISTDGFGERQKHLVHMGFFLTQNVQLLSDTKCVISFQNQFPNFPTPAESPIIPFNFDINYPESVQTPQAKSSAQQECPYFRCQVPRLPPLLFHLAVLNKLKKSLEALLEINDKDLLRVLRFGDRKHN